VQNPKRKIALIAGLLCTLAALVVFALIRLGDSEIKQNLHEMSSDDPEIAARAEEMLLGCDHAVVAEELLRRLGERYNTRECDLVIRIMLLYVPDQASVLRGEEREKSAKLKPILEQLGRLDSMEHHVLEVMRIGDDRRRTETMAALRWFQRGFSVPIYLSAVASRGSGWTTATAHLLLLQREGKLDTMHAQIVGVWIDRALEDGHGTLYVFQLGAMAELGSKKALQCLIELLQNSETSAGDRKQAWEWLRNVMDLEDDSPDTLRGIMENLQRLQYDMHRRRFQLATPKTSSAEVVALIESMPTWVKLHSWEKQEKEQAQIEAAIRKIAGYDTDVIRSAEEFYLAADRGATIDRTGQLYILNKFLFDLPEKVRLDSPASNDFGGWWMNRPIHRDPRNPEDVGEVSMRWPWSENAQGAWRLTGRSNIFSGPPYQALQAFDFYRETYGRRK